MKFNTRFNPSQNPESDPFPFYPDYSAQNPQIIPLAFYPDYGAQNPENDPFPFYPVYSTQNPQIIPLAFYPDYDAQNPENDPFPIEDNDDHIRAPAPSNAKNPKKAVLSKNVSYTLKPFSIDRNNGKASTACSSDSSALSSMFKKGKLPRPTEMDCTTESPVKNVESSGGRKSKDKSGEMVVSSEKNKPEVPDVAEEIGITDFEIIDYNDLDDDWEIVENPK